MFLRFCPLKVMSPKYQRTVCCNFWQPRGSPFTAKPDFGTPAPTKLEFHAPPRYGWPGSNPCLPSLVRKVEKIKFFGFFTDGFVSKCHKTIEYNFWHPQGSDCTAYSNNGTPAQTKRIFFVPPRCTRQSPNPLSHSMASNEELIIFSASINFGLVCECQKTVGCNF